MYYLVNEQRKSRIGTGHFYDTQKEIGSLGGQEFIEYHERDVVWNKRGDRKTEVWNFVWRKKVLKNGKLSKVKLKSSLI